MTRTAPTSAPHSRNVDLDRILEATRAGQWSVHEFDWSAPLEGVEGRSKRELREIGQMLVFTAGLERLGARVFDWCAHYLTDNRAKQIYELFAIDERRHAQAEIRLAKRLGVSWKDQPLVVRSAFHNAQRHLARSSRLMHEALSVQIILFEIGLDSMLIPALKDIDDPLQAEVFRRIDLDESRHLAMDYWLLERKARGVDSARPMPRLRDVSALATIGATMPAAFLANGFGVRGMLRKMGAPERAEQYWRRVSDVPRKAPGAMKLPAYRNGVELQRLLQRVMGLGLGYRAKRAA